jgi:hypothetical protein
MTIKPTKSTGLSKWWCIAIVLSIPVVLVALILQVSPSVKSISALDKIDVQSIEQLIVNNAPSSINSTGERSLSLDKDEIDLLSTFALQNMPNYPDVAATISLHEGSTNLALSWPVKLLSLDLYLNLHAELTESHTGPHLSSITAGKLPIPLVIVKLLAKMTQDRLAATYVNYKEFTDLYDSIRHINFHKDELIVVLDWEPRLITRVQAQAEQLFLSAEDRERILSYYGQIVAIVNALPQDTRRISLNALIFPLFQTAQAKTALGADVYTENRAALQALSLYVNDSDISSLVAGRSPNETPRRINVTIQRRPDLAQHFTTSAAITASVGANIAGILSNSKEDYDARYRTGFSFSDLTANIAGVALGNAVTLNPETAKEVQAHLANAIDETDYMPRVSRNNAGITEQDFTDQYQNRNSEAYLERLNAINLEISQLPIYSPRL